MRICRCGFKVECSNPGKSRNIEYRQLGLCIFGKLI